jgi:hypothetical protein
MMDTAFIAIKWLGIAVLAFGFLLSVGIVLGGFLRRRAYQMQRDNEAQVQALLDYQAMTALEREFPIAR